MATRRQDGSADRAPRERSVKAVLHAVDVLEALARAGRPMGVTDLSREVGLTKASVFNLLATLESRRLVTQQQETSLYRLDWGLHELAAAVAQDVELARESHDVVTALAQRVGETVLLGVRRDDSVVYIDKAESTRHRIRMVVDVGSNSPLHSTATGKLLLAYAEADDVKRVLRRRLERRTPLTITDPAKLRAELEEVRERGYAVAVGENEPDLASVAVPVWDHTGAVVAALTLASLQTRFEQGIETTLPLLRESAAELSARVGGHPVLP
jgi:IclR family transcriptional regulator, KDG regulon repressor